MGKRGYGVYMFFASLLIFSALFVFFFISETKGTPLEAMDRLFKINPKYKANQISLAELQIEEEMFRGRVSNASFSAGGDDVKHELQYVEHDSVRTGSKA